MKLPRGLESLLTARLIEMTITAHCLLLTVEKIERSSPNYISYTRLNNQIEVAKLMPEILFSYRFRVGIRVYI